MSEDAHRPARRRFLASASATALVLSAHRYLAWATSATETAMASDRFSAARIVRLQLDTAAPLEQMKAFYHGKLGLPILEQSANALTIGGGTTPITFVAAAPELGEPFYHFAFNIPENKLRGAREWQRARTELLPIFPQSRDPDYPDDVIHFANWNAHSIFFFDPAGNVVEYIARHDLQNAAAGPFTSDDILYASEIGFVVDDVPAVATALESAFDLNRYRGGSAAFTAIGDEYGLLLVFKRGRNLSLGHSTPRHADIFPTQVEIRGGPATRYDLPGFPFEITRVDEPTSR